MSLSTIVVNHEVRPVGSLNDAGMGKMLSYYSREGEFREIGGCDRGLTKADLDLERRAAIRTIDDLIDYGSRRGRFSRKGKDAPITAGERSGACFGQHGPVDPELLKRELAESGSHIVTSVVSVRREDAERLGLASKEGFEDLLRKEWTRQCEQWGVIEPQDIRWAAWYHVDNEKSLHVHVVTWDRSGRFSEPGAIIPRDQVWSSQTGLRREALKGSIEELNRERTFLRDWICYRVRIDMGEERDAGREGKLAEQAARCDARVDDPDMQRTVGERDRERIEAKVVERMPEDAVRSYSYARSNEQVRNAAVDAVHELRRKDSALDAAFARYEQIVREVSEGIGLRSEPERSGEAYRNPAEEYFRDATFDLNRRAANGILRNCSPVRVRELHRSPELARMREDGSLLDRSGREEYGRKAAKAASRASRRPLTEAQERAVRERAEGAAAKISERRERDSARRESESARERADVRERAPQGRVEELAHALASLIPTGVRTQERGSHEGMVRPKRHRSVLERDRDERKR